MKKAFFSLIFLLGVPFSFAHASFVSVSQGILDTPSASTCNAGDCATVNIGNGYIGTTTSIIETISTASGAFHARVDLIGYPSSSYTVGTAVSDCYFTDTFGSGDQKFIQLLTQNESPAGSCVFNPALYYQVLFDNQTSGTKLWGASVNTHAWDVSFIQGIGGIAIPQFALIADSFQIVPSASSSGIFFSGAVDFCNARFASSTGIGAIFGNGLCIALGYLFVPTADSLQQFSGLPAIMQTKVPFVYAYSLYNIFGSFSTTTVNSMVAVSLPLHDLGLGSTTAMGNILPNWQALSSSTVMTYMSQQQLDVFKTLIVIVLWAGLATMMFFEVKHLIQS